MGKDKNEAWQSKCSYYAQKENSISRRTEENCCRAARALGEGESWAEIGLNALSD